jgi:hypothetical protein
VTANLLRNGGRCPKCLIEVPGEEAATDPGEAVKAAQQAQVEARVERSRRTQIMGFVVAGLSIIGGALAIAFWPEQPMPVIVIDDWDYNEEHTALAVAEPAAPEASPGKHAAPERSPRKATNSERTSEGRSEAVAGRGEGLPSTMGSAPEAAPEDAVASTSRASIGTGQVNTATSMDDIFGGPAAGGPKARELSDEDEIRKAIMAVQRSRGPQAAQCYEQQVGSKPSLKGRWIVEFTISKEGKPSQVKATGQGVSDSELENCLVRNVSSWTFARMAKPQPVALPFNFKPQG